MTHTPKISANVHTYIFIYVLAACFHITDKAYSKKGQDNNRCLHRVHYGLQ